MNDDIWPPPCIHSPDGRTLCPDCQATYDGDPESYIEFGDHPAGLKNWRALQDEIARGAEERTQSTDPELPF